MVFLPLAFLLLLPCVEASRISADVHEMKNQNHHFGLSCETLHTRFRKRSENLHVFVASHSGSDDMGLGARARAVMKSSAVLRTLRRAKDCPWIAAGNNDDLEAIGKVVKVVLAGNPCAPAALAELQLLDTDDVEETMHLNRAMSILMSDTCKIDAPEENVDVPVDFVEGDELEIEERVQDGVEEMLESEDAGNSLMEQSDAQRSVSFARVAALIGALMIGVLFSLGCAYVVANIGLFVGMIFTVMLVAMTSWMAPVAVLVGTVGWYGSMAAMYTGGFGGAAMCGKGFFKVVNATLL